MQLNTDLHRYFKDLNKNIYTPFGWYLNFLYLSVLSWLVQSSTIEPKCLALFTVCVGSRPIILLDRVVQSARLNQPRELRHVRWLSEANHQNRSIELQFRMEWCPFAGSGYKCEIWKILKSLILGWFPVLHWKLRCCWRYINAIHFN